MFWIGIIFLMLGGLYWYILNRHKYWEQRGVKQKSTINPFGHSLDSFIGDHSFYDLIMKIYNRFPDSRYLGHYHLYMPVIVLREPELIKQMCVRDFEHFPDHRPFIPKNSDPMWNKMLFVLTGQKWKDTRVILSPSFTSSKIRKMFILMHECAKKCAVHLSENPEQIQELDLKDLFSRYANDMIATTAFGIQCDSLKDPENEFYIKGRQSTDFSGRWKFIKLMLIFLCPSLDKILEVSIFNKEISDFFRKIIAETIEYREKNNIERPDMLNQLMQARKGTQQEDEPEAIKENNFAVVEEHLKVKPRRGKIDLSLDDITAQALGFFFGGFETVSNAMSIMGYELAVNPDVQQKLMKELDEFRATHKTLSYEDVAKLIYLDMVVSETLRKWPTNFLTDRQCVKPYTIEPQHPDEQPVHLTENDTLWVPIWALHHDPKYWENPDKFDPERFSPENKKNIVPYSYLPFGVGPRNCIGSRFAIIQMKVVFYELLARFEIVPIEKSCIPFQPNKRAFNLASTKGFWFGLKKRMTTEL